VFWPVTVTVTVAPCGEVFGMMEAISARLGVTEKPAPLTACAIAAASGVCATTLTPPEEPGSEC